MDPSQGLVEGHRDFQMRATGWRNGKYGFGIRVGRENARRHFREDWRAIRVEIDGQDHEFPLRGTFWTTCPEFRGVAIGRWLRRLGMHAWEKGRPPVLELEPLGDRRFRATLATAVRSS
ncbi:MAG: hypothetical protein JWN86_3931 [Planctomycetota bacterium]|nr:hypothetical protein [Planctomycetota bacterium]